MTNTNMRLKSTLKVNPSDGSGNSNAECLYAQIEKCFPSKDDKHNVDSRSGKISELFVEHVQDKLRGQELESMESLISKKQRKHLTKKIFRNDTEEFNLAIQLINRIEIWENAYRFIEELLAEKNVDPYSKEALEFSTLVYLRYHSKDNGFHNGKALKY
jgi:hypothetical protein